MISLTMIKIRIAETKDIPQIQCFMDKLNETREKQYSKSTKLFHKKLASSKKFTVQNLKKNLYLVAQENGVLVGFICASLYTLDSYTLSKRASIDELYVTEDARKKGIAKKLVNRLQKELRSKGCTALTVKTDFENTIAQSFYKTIGMKEVTVEFWKKL